MEYHFASGRYVYELLHESAAADVRALLIADETKMLSTTFASLGRRHRIDVAALSDIFNLQSDRCGSLVSSRFVPISVHDYKTIYKTYDVEPFNKKTPIENEDFGLGFLQRARHRNSFTIPTIILSDKMLSRIAPYEPGIMLEKLAELYTFSNHDYWHHFTAELTNPDIVRANLDNWDSSLKKNLSSQFSTGDKSARSLESFFLLSHATSFQDLYKNTETFRQKFDDTFDQFFNELERIKSEMETSFSLFGNSSTVSRVVNYFGKSAMFAIERVFDPREEIFEKGFDRIRSLDPLTKRKGGTITDKERLFKISPEIPNLMQRLFNTHGINDDDISRVHRVETIMIDSIIEDTRPDSTCRLAEPRYI